MLKYLLFSLRPKQWIKNLFIFPPLIFGKKLLVFPANLKTVIAFCLFSLAAGVAYVINDIIDIEKDRFIPTKRLRPIASGKISIRQAAITAFILGALSIVLSFMLDISFGCVIIVYLLFNFLYSKVLKNIVIIDVFCIGGFFLLRIISGGITAEVVLSYWIIILTVLLALFLGFNKRRQELGLLKRKAIRHRQALKGYTIRFIDRITVVITLLIAISYMLYVVDARTVREFGTKNLIFSIPFAYYGIFRYLYLIHTVKRDGDPTRILLSDKMMQWDLGLWIVVCMGVIYL